jgi:hypothetical protein
MNETVEWAAMKASQQQLLLSDYLALMDLNIAKIYN